MSQSKDSIGNVLLIAVSVCLVCSILVSGAAVALKPQQEANEILNQKQNVLVAAGLLAEGETQDVEISAAFSGVMSAGVATDR